MPPTRHDVILPSLLDRLTYNGTSKQDSVGWFLNPSGYMDTVRRDLLWLLKTDATRSEEVLLTDTSRGKADQFGNDFPDRYLGDFPKASRSVLAFGVPVSRGAMVSGTNGQEFKRALEHAIKAFEPRLERLSVRVSSRQPAASDEEKASVFVISVEISGQVRIKMERLDLLLQAYYTPAFAHWRIDGVANGP